MTNMSKSTEVLKQNLQDKIEQMREYKLEREYIYAIKKVSKEIWNEPVKPLTFISGSNTIYDIDNVECIVIRHTPNMGF
jgi:hypothetical protein